jgi:hypothetical protein
VADRGAKPHVVGQGGAEPDRVVALAVEPVPQQVQHRVGKTLAAAAFAIVRLLRLDQDDAARRAAPACATAEKVPNAVIDDTRQPVVVAMQVIGMAGKARADRLDAARGVAHQPHGVCLATLLHRGHPASP